MIDKVLKRIRFERFKRGLSQQFVAGELKISQSYYAKIESGKNTLTVKVLFRISEIFKIEPEELIK